MAEGHDSQEGRELAHISIHPFTVAASTLWQGGDIPEEGTDLSFGPITEDGGSSSVLGQQQVRSGPGGGPVCEGRDQQQVKPSVQFQQVDDSELAQRAKSVSNTPVQQKVQVSTCQFFNLAELEQPLAGRNDWYGQQHIGRGGCLHRC